jgi:hypothetical protein
MVYFMQAGVRPLDTDIYSGDTSGERRTGAIFALVLIVLLSLADVLAPVV